MPPSNWRKNSSVTPAGVIQRVLERPFDYSFFQVVRLLERAAFYLNRQESTDKNHNVQKYGHNPVALFTRPDSEVFRFKAHQTLTFPGSEIAAIAAKKNTSSIMQWHITTNFIGLTGATGIMPYHYTELILQRLKLKDQSMPVFLNLFNHRITSLFYQASTKYFLPIEYERKQLNRPVKRAQDTITHSLLSLIGLGTPGVIDNMHNPYESLLYYSGLLSKQLRTTTGLRQILQHYFDIPVTVKEFVGQWRELIEDVRSRLPSKALPKGQNARLGQSAILGYRGWFAQGKIRIILGPLNKWQLDHFAPGTKTITRLNEFVRIYVGMEIDYDFIIRVKRSDIPDKIQLSKDKPPIIGWNTWLAQKAKPQLQSDNTLDIMVSPNRIN